ncbi:FtsX-like permease family protein [Nonomuraea sp. NPDC002799]
MSAFRAALRISRRDALRFKGRTALIMVMIGLPVLVITAVLTLVDTTGVTAREELASQLGPVADARITTTYYRDPVEQDPAGRYPNRNQSGDRPPTWTPAEVNALIAGRLLPIQGSRTEALLSDGYDEVEVLETDLLDPLAAGIRPLSEGRIPATTDEVAVTPALLGRGVRLGGTLKVTRQGKPLRVVGVVEHPNRPGIRELVGRPGAMLRDRGDGSGAAWLIDTSAPVRWADVRRLNKAGLLVASRAVIESPRGAEIVAPDDGRTLRWTAVGVILVVTETALLAGPAFAVGLRRRRRELAVIAAQGGSAGHLRMIVLADGLVLGGAAALLGVVLGAGAGLLAETVTARMLDWTSGPPDVPWAQALGVAALGLVSALAAALVPALQAARQHPAQVLAGRPGDLRGRAGRPVLGLVLIVLGLGATALAAARSELAVVVASTVVVFGVIAVTPWLVRRTGRLAARLPLPMRLSVRDGARHTGRTASAMAAVMGATMAAVALGITFNSSFAVQNVHRLLDAPDGSMQIRGHSLDDPTWAKMRAVAGERLPGASLVAGAEARDKSGRSLNVLVNTGIQPCDDACSFTRSSFYDLPVGDARLLAFLQGRRDSRAAAALAAGKAVVFDPGLIRKGEIAVSFEALDASKAPAAIRVPAVLATSADSRQGGGVLPPSALTGAGLKTAERRLYAMHQPADPERFERDLRAVHGNVHVALTRSDDEIVYLLAAALAGALILVLGGTLAATGLAAADMRGDLDTLSAVGGRPRTRRLVVASQAGYIAGLGAVLGLAGGIVAGVALTWRTASRYGLPEYFSVPWAFVAAVVLGLPLLAALLAGLFTRARPRLARRVA